LRTFAKKFLIVFKRGPAFFKPQSLRKPVRKAGLRACSVTVKIANKLIAIDEKATNQYIVLTPDQRSCSCQEFCSMDVA